MPLSDPSQPHSQGTSGCTSLVHEFERRESDGGRHPILDDMLVIDFNPQVRERLAAREIAGVYGDVAHMDTLHHANVHVVRASDPAAAHSLRPAGA